MGAFEFHTNYRYTDREAKARYIWPKYPAILTGRILEVGAESYLIKHDPVHEYGGLGRSIWLMLLTMA
jgi:hypothetical protein